MVIQFFVETWYDKIAWMYIHVSDCLRLQDINDSYMVVGLTLSASLLGNTN